LFHFRAIALDPPPDGDVIGAQAPLGEQLLDVAVAPAGQRPSQTAVIYLVPLANLKFPLTTDYRQPTTDN
jgi:hypothetical protein